jgi:hypothetical protein
MQQYYLSSGAPIEFVNDSHLHHSAVGSDLYSTMFTAGFALCVGVWVHWALTKKWLTIKNDDNITSTDILKHSILSAAAFALYTISFGSHSEAVKGMLTSAAWQKQFTAAQAVLMVACPMILKFFGSSYVARPENAAREATP